jgi:hypothetical protein
VKCQPLQANAEFVWTELFALSLFSANLDIPECRFINICSQVRTKKFLDLLRHDKERSKRE